MRILLIGMLVCLGTGTAAAQPGATGPVATLNAEAKALSETDPERSLTVALEALAAARAAGDVRGEAEALNYVAYGYRNQSLLDIAKQNAEDSIRLSVSLGDAWGEAQGYNTLGLIEADAGRFPEALEAHLKALAIRERTGDKEGLSYSYNNLGNAYRNIGEYETALEYHAQGLALKIELGNRSSEAYSHHNMGLVYFAMGRFPDALAAYRRGMAIREELNDPRGIAVALNAIGQVEVQTDPAAALRTYAQALALRRQVGDTRGEMATELNLGDVFRRIGNVAGATAAFNRALTMAEEIEAPLMRSNALRSLAELEAARGDYQAAYAHQLQYQQVRDQMFNQENAERLQRLQVAHDTDRQQRQIRLLEQEGALRTAELTQVRTTRTALAAIALLVLVSLALLYGRFRLKQQSEARFRAQAEALSEALDRVNALKGLLPICASCKNIRDDNGYWTQVEAYVSSHSAAEFTHSICPSCAERLYPEYLPAPGARTP
ncbi:MAG: tetratricopeptide repeat protein [Vicinamibacterales bacterium]|nr:tetratricopeptide repeat protein [Vicinamibacterales bacterium]